MTDAEQAFMTMVKFTERGQTLGCLYWLYKKNAFHVARVMAGDKQFAVARDSWPDPFPIIGSTFEALANERPDVLPFYESAKAWSESQC